MVDPEEKNRSSDMKGVVKLLPSRDFCISRRYLTPVSLCVGVIY